MRVLLPHTTHLTKKTTHLGTPLLAGSSLCRDSPTKNPLPPKWRVVGQNWGTKTTRLVTPILVGSLPKSRLARFMARVEKAHNLVQNVKDFQQAKIVRRFAARALQNKGGLWLQIALMVPDKLIIGYIVSSDKNPVESVGVCRYEKTCPCTKKYWYLITAPSNSQNFLSLDQSSCSFRTMNLFRPPSNYSKFTLRGCRKRYPPNIWGVPRTTWVVDKIFQKYPNKILPPRYPHNAENYPSMRG